MKHFRPLLARRVNMSVNIYMVYLQIPICNALWVNAATLVFTSMGWVIIIVEYFTVVFCLVISSQLLLLVVQVALFTVVILTREVNKHVKYCTCQCLQAVVFLRHLLMVGRCSLLLYQTGILVSVQIDGEDSLFLYEVESTIKETFILQKLKNSYTSWHYVLFCNLPRLQVHSHLTI
jgi:hypothetical protein